MFSKIQEDVSAQIDISWIKTNERQIIKKQNSVLTILKAIFLDERLWPIVAFRYRKLKFLGNLFKIVLIFSRIVLGVKLGGKIGPGCAIGHAASIFVNSKATIGKNLRINQNTIIAGGSQDGYPFLGNNVHVSAGAKIIGNIKVGDNVHIGANSVVVNDVPNNCTVVGIPAKIVRLENKRVDIQLKQFWENIKK